MLVDDKGNKIEPYMKVGQIWRDSVGRQLEITAVDPDSRLGRNVIGMVTHDGVTYEYATDFRIFQTIWTQLMNAERRTLFSGFVAKADR